MTGGLPPDVLRCRFLLSRREHPNSGDILDTAGDPHSLAADKGYNWQELREKSREEGVRPLIKHREFSPIDHAHNARIDSADYGQRALSETVFSSIKRTLGHVVRGRAWYREFREIVAMCLVYNIKRSVTHPN